jgi:solute carrier family 8 (sodium/calcium exchanger)
MCYCRLWLAALHFNENTQRDQAVTQDGKARYRLTVPKYKKGEFIVRKINVDCTYCK